MPKISVIVPIYNVGNYIYECLDSIANQTMIDEIEVILVDDGSTDNCRYIIERYAQDYKNFHAYHKKNGGLGNARNFGLKISKGEYVTFIDSDDYIPPDSLEKRYYLAKKHDHDMVTGNFIRFNDDYIWKVEIMQMIFRSIEEDIENTHFRQHPDLAWDVPSWNKIYKREFLDKNDLRFPDENVKFEDNLFVMKSHYLAKSIGIIHDDIYYWRSRSQSISKQKMDLALFKDRIEMMNEVYEFMESTISEDKLKKMIFHKFINMDLLTITHDIINVNLNNHEIVDDIIKIIKLIPDEIINEVNTYRRLLIKMLENKDFDGMDFVIKNYGALIAKSDQAVFENINDKYHKYINTYQDLQNGILSANVNKIHKENDNILISLKILIPYCPKPEFEVKAKLITDEMEDLDLEVIDNNSILLPIDLITANLSRIKIEYCHKEIYKETYLKYDKLTSLDFPAFEVNFTGGINKEIYVSKRLKNKNNIVIENVNYIDDELVFKGKCQGNVNFFLENCIDFKRVDLKTEFKSDYEFTSKIDYDELIKVPIKKWQLKADEFNNILFSDDKTFYTQKYEINISNKNNGIFIESNLYDILDTINQLNNKWDESIRKNKKLLTQNKKLNKRIKKFKSRKIVRFADYLKKL